MEFYPYEKGGGKCFSLTEGGAQKVLGWFLPGSLEVLAILKEVHKKFPLFRRGEAKSFSKI